MTTSFGKYLQYLRIKKKMSIVDLSHLSGISQSHISRIERELRPTPSPKIIAKIASALDVNYEELLSVAGYLNKSNTNLQPQKQLKWIGQPHPVRVYTEVPSDQNSTLSSLIGIAMAYNPETEYILKVKDDSMIPALNKNELVEIKSVTDDLSNGQIAVIVHEGVAACRYFISTNKGTYFKASNPLYPIIENAKVIGVVLSVLKTCLKLIESNNYIHPETINTSDLHLIGPELAFNSKLESIIKVKTIKIEEKIPPEGIRNILSLSLTEKAILYSRVHFLDDIPVSFIESWLPHDLFRDIVAQEEALNKPLFRILEEKKSIHTVKCDERIRIDNASHTVAKQLSIIPGSCIAHIQRAVYADNDRVIEFAFISAQASYWEFAYKYATGSRVSAPGWDWLQVDQEYKS